MKKKSCCFCKSNLFNLTLLLQFHLLLSLSENHYGDCEPRKCGNQTIKYPFHIQNDQKPYCGYPGFGVSCNFDSFPVFNISGDAYIIKNISYETQKFQVINSALVEDVPSSRGCFHSLHNLTMPHDSINFSMNNDYLYVFPDCPEKVLKEYRDKRVNCGRLAVYKNDSNLQDLEKKCNGVVIEVPYYVEDQTKGKVMDMLERGVLLNWKAYNCTVCLKSGGQCGFDEPNSQFNCFCPDRTHALQCKEPPVHKKVQLQLILGLGIGGVVLVFLALLAVWHRKKLKFGHPKYVSRSVSLDRSASDLERGSVYFGIPLFTYTELIEATDNFSESRELGDGGFGIVYYGKLKDGREVAVKRLYEKSFRRVEQFMNEIQILTRLRHQNLVTLYGCTSQHCRELLLVYEYVENGTVADHLFGEKAKPGSLTWPIRLRIAIETASALSYLHASDIIHRDVKTSNILLDSSFKVRVADFGLSRLFPTDVTHVSTAPQGTPGYLDPEYHQCYQLTDRSDVYSFGVVLIELISSLPAIDLERNRSEINLSNYAMNRIQRCAFDELVDPKLGFASDFKVKRMTTLVAELAFQCLQHDKEFRPSMDEILESLNRIESSDYDALQEEEMANDTGEVVKTQSSCPPSSSIDDDHAQLLNTRQLHPPSPISVMDKWDSRSTIQSKDK
ncbi:LEAF RUST 10 DISEASE-RESISTANCE LOCUS RECEPTOR-LIKE PROTEIN KINASE-like 1.2 isoform X1 [Chenopodium quinoa]|uniref:LEAF RUST 10 DISEASE-RESISTANCE LOCUS RECEPTOR-LIKE PROTEIN KINASE-like 1.2 isoform X1 n=1 Tax=Chenopodium quinoa TaxID=63459 RepID=UPI000B78825F|nr:LEAF RUST 10 DISEASE-RESISTANCE LOCUS RECEPTOR-LIKE PROTEIN KINASE-like 1.2 isoform X1 [Chenopodium quinoa]